MQRSNQEIKKLYALVPEAAITPDIKAIIDGDHLSTLNIARFHYQDKPYDSWSKDFEFSQQSLTERFTLGYNDVQQAFKDPTWIELLPETIQLHNF